MPLHSQQANTTVLFDCQPGRADTFKFTGNPKSEAAKPTRPDLRRYELTPNHWPIQVAGWSCTLLGSLFIATFLNVSIVLLLGLALVIVGVTMDQAARHLNRQAWVQRHTARSQETADCHQSGIHQSSSKDVSTNIGSNEQSEGMLIRG